MTTTPDPKTVREIARDCVADYIDDARDIAAHVMGHFGMGVPGDVYAWTDAVRTDLRAVVPSWPAEQLQDERAAIDRNIADLLSDENLDAHRISASIQAAIRQVRADLAEMTRCRNAAMAYAERQHVPIELDDEIDIDGEELASRIEGELLGPGWDWEDDRTAGLLAKQAVAVIRPHLARLTDQAQNARKAAQTERPHDDADTQALAETVVRLKRWLAGRQGKVHSVVSSTSVIAEPRDRSTAAWAIAESDVRAVVDAPEARGMKAQAVPTAGWILWDAEGRWIGSTTSPKDDGWRAVSINDAEAQEWQQRGCILDRMDEAGWHAYNAGRLDVWQFEPGSRDKWLTARDAKAGE